MAQDPGLKQPGVGGGLLILSPGLPSQRPRMAGWPWSLKGAALHSHLLHSSSRVPQKSRGALPMEGQVHHTTSSSHALYSHSRLQGCYRMIYYKQLKRGTCCFKCSSYRANACTLVFPGSCSVSFRSCGRGLGYKANIEKSVVYILTANNERLKF